MSNHRTRKGESRQGHEQAFRYMKKCSKEININVSCYLMFNKYIDLVCIQVNCIKLFYQIICLSSLTCK